MFVDEEIKLRVKKGADLLDEFHEDGELWARQIDVIGLDLSNCSRCVLGQLYWGYMHGLEELGLNDDDTARELGFDVDARSVGALDLSYTAKEKVLEQQYEQLRQAWLGEIDARRGGY